MFQIAAASALAWNNGDVSEFCLKRHKSLTQGNSAESYKDTIFRNLNVACKPRTGRPMHRERKHSCYVPIEYKPNMVLRGYYQSEKYFVGHRDRLRALFGEPTRPSSGQYVALHVRRGDYLLHSKSHSVQSSKYYHEAMSHFDGDQKFLVCSDDLEWCRQNLRGNLTFVDADMPDYEQLLRMSRCSHQIMSNSSFSWWAAYLNDNPDKIVIAPKLWYGPAFDGEVGTDMYSNWMKVI